MILEIEVSSSLEELQTSDCFTSAGHHQALIAITNVLRESPDISPTLTLYFSLSPEYSKFL